VHTPQKAIDCLELLKDYGADCGVLVAYGKIVPEEVIAMFPRGILNLHPSLLPKLRGSTPLETAILTGVQETGVSVMKLIKAMDAGVVYTQIPMHINSSITKQELSDTLHKAGADAVLDVLNDLDTFTDSDKEQVEAEATFSARISKSDGNIDWNESATDIERKIRAYAGWPKSYCTLAGARYILHSAEIAQGHIAEKPGDYIVTESTLGIQTSDGSLYITSLQPEGKKVMPIKAFLAGYRNKLS
jgi:methionyl-tRNA formyltransferase